MFKCKSDLNRWPSDLQKCTSDHKCYIYDLQKCKSDLQLITIRPANVYIRQLQMHIYPTYKSVNPNYNQWLSDLQLCTSDLKMLIFRPKCKSDLQSWPSDLQIFNFNNNLFLDKDCGHKLTHTNKNEISINLFPVCYQSLSIILFCSRLVKSHTPQRFVLRHCLKNLTMGNPVYHSEHLFCAGWSCFLFFP